MLTWVRRNRGTILFVLTLVVTGLLVGNAWKARLVSLAWLATQKDTIGALNSIVGMFVLVIGSIFSYFRFFRGRTLSLRSELAITVSVHVTTEKYLIHAITLSAKNVGNATIWNPLPHISARVHAPPHAQTTIEIGDWEHEQVQSAEMVPVVDPGETVTFFAVRHIASEAWAVTYSASLRADQGDTWHVCKTVSNKTSSKDG
jgi:hypothetical protein